MSIEWSMRSHVAEEKCHHLLYRSQYNGKGVQMEIHTPKRKSGKFGEPRVYFFMDGDPREFREEGELLKALEEAEA